MGPPRSTTALALAISVATMVVALASAELAFRGSTAHHAFIFEARHAILAYTYPRLERESDIVAIGDSRVIHGFHPPTIEALIAQRTGTHRAVHNLGLAGAPATGHLAWTSYLLQQEKPPSLVIFYVSPYMFSDAQNKSYAKEIVDHVFQSNDAWVAWRAGMPLEEAMTIVWNNLASTLRFRRRILTWLREDEALKPAINLGDHGFQPAGRTWSQTQQRLAQARSQATREVLDPDADIWAAQFQFLRTAIRRLQDAGITVIITTPPTASSIWRYYNDATLYAPIMARLHSIAEAEQVPFFEYRETTRVADYYFFDGDHLNPEGARRHSALLTYRVILPALGYTAPEPLNRWSATTPTAGCRTLFDFESTATLTSRGWTRTGPAFEHGAVTGAQGAQHDVHNMQGLQLINSHHRQLGDRVQGSLRSPSFRIETPSLALLIAGGRRDDRLAIELWVNHTRVRSATGDDSEVLRRVVWDVRPWLGTHAYLKIIDRDSGPWGHVIVDQIEQCAAP